METNKLKEILIELLKEESYGACDIQTWVDIVTGKQLKNIKQRIKKKYFRD